MNNTYVQKGMLKELKMVSVNVEFVLDKNSARESDLKMKIIYKEYGKLII
jgi:hypothetical protein